MTFYDREEKELEEHPSAFESPGSDLFVVYVPRRVGKTELLKEFCADRPHIYFLAAQEAVWEGIRRGDVEPYSEVGRWWYREDEIDIVGLAPNDDRILLAECKWTSDRVGEALVESLRAKAANVRWGPGDRDQRFALFSKSGFVDGLGDELGENWLLFTLTEIDELLTPE